jgi:hypothetical protein
MDSTNGIKVSHGTSSVTVAASGVTIVNGSLSSPVITGGSLTITTSAGQIVTISSSTSGVQVADGTNTTHLGTTVISIATTGSVVSSLSPNSLVVGQNGGAQCGFNATPGSTNTGLMVGGRIVCQNDSNTWLGGLQAAGVQVFAGEFGIYGTAVGWPQTATNNTGPGGSGPGLPMGQYSTFATGDGRTAYVQGGLIVNVK